jgi:hypothetical protein
MTIATQSPKGEFLPIPLFGKEGLEEIFRLNAK